MKARLAMGIALLLAGCNVVSDGSNEAATGDEATDSAVVRRSGVRADEIVTPIDPRGAVQNGIVLADFDTLRLGAKIVGPVGPEVQASLATGLAALGDIESWVACPAGARRCEPGNLPADTLYTYVHAITPGVDRANDRPFPQPEAIDPVKSAMRFRIEAPLHGFTGKAGYSFDDAQDAMGGDGGFTVACETGALVFTAAEGSRPWATGRTIRFYWQTIAPSAGPGPGYALQADGKLGRGTGPRPAKIATANDPASPAANVPCG